MKLVLDDQKIEWRFSIAQRQRLFLAAGSFADRRTRGRPWRRPRKKFVSVWISRSSVSGELQPSVNSDRESQRLRPPRSGPRPEMAASRPGEPARIRRCSLHHRHALPLAGGARLHASGGSRPRRRAPSDERILSSCAREQGLSSLGSIDPAHSRRLGLEELGHRDWPRVGGRS